ncbi:MAG: Pterin-4-alpha-carbinolamine dehydratase [Actinomycetota bacterium]|nr:Pterin-4-alpha-carbinolamine dehydratase [Actinomycetota bacterium]
MSSEISPEQFRAADGVEDWRLLFDGANVFYRTQSMLAGASLAGTIGALDGMADLEAAVDLRADGVTVRLSWYSGFTEQHISLAQQISVAAHAVGGQADASRVQVVQIAVDALSMPAAVAFWRVVLGYRQRGDEDLFDDRGRGPQLWFQQMDEPRPQRNRIHVDISLPRVEAHARVHAAIAAGGILISDSHAPLWWSLADPEGNEVDIAAHTDID